MSASLNKQQKAGLSKTTLNSHSSVSGFKHISSPSVTQTVRKISPAGSGKVAKGNGEQTSGSSHRQTSRSSHRQTSGLSHRQTSRSSHRQTSGLSHSQMAGSSHKQAVGSGKAQTSEADRKSAQMGRLSKEDMDSSSVSKVSSKVRKEGGTVKKVVPGGKATGQSGQCVKSRFKDQPGRSGHSSLKKTGQKDSSTMKGSLKDEPKGAVHVRHKKKEVSGSGSGPLNFAELMKMATDNKDGKKFKPEKGIKPNLSHKSEESDVTKHTMKNASKSEKLTKSNQNGIARQPLSEKIKSVNPFPTRSPVTPATAESPHNSMCGKHSSKQLPLVKSNSVKPKTVKANPTVASKSFYSGSVGRKSLARPSPYGTSSSYLEQLEQTFAEMKRKRAQLELEEDYDSYDDEDGFVVDDDEDDVDVSATIRNIFGYDRSKCVCVCVSA